MRSSHGQDRGNVSRSPTCRLAAATVLLASGCVAAIRVGPEHEIALDVEELVRSARAGAEAVDTLYAPRCTLKLSGVVIRLFANVFLKGMGRFRLQVQHVMDDVLTLVAKEGEFLVEDYRKKKGYRGRTMAVVSDRFPDLKLRPEDLSPRRLFLPTLDPAPGESLAFVRQGRRYVVEYWKPGHGLTRQTEVDVWSRAVTRNIFYLEDGRVAVVLRWDRFAYYEEQGLALAHEVDVRMPVGGHAMRIVMFEPRLNKPIRDRAFALRPTPGVEIEQVPAPGRGESPEKEAHKPPLAGGSGGGDADASE